MIAGSYHNFSAPYPTGGIFRSTNAGATWDTVGLRGMSVNRIIQTPLGSRTLYAAADLGLYRSYDDGMTWNFVTDYGVGGFAFIKSIAVDQLDTLHLLLAVGGPAGGTLGASTDGGNSWHTALIGIFYGVTFHSFSPNHAYAWSGQWGVWQSTDHGYSWDQWHSDDVFVEPSHVRSRIWVSHRYALSWTDNFGLSWSTALPESVDYVGSIVQEVMSDTGIAVGSQGGAYLILDPIGEWEPLTNGGLPNWDCRLVGRTVDRSTLFGSFDRGLWDYTVESNSVQDRVELVVAPYEVYPNPAVDQLNLSLPQGKWSVSLYNVLGQRVEDRRFEVHQGNGPQPWQFNNLASGTYFLLVRPDQINASEKKWVAVIQILN